jgi:hypothetical protein
LSRIVFIMIDVLSAERFPSTEIDEGSRDFFDDMPAGTCERQIRSNFVKGELRSPLPLDLPRANGLRLCPPPA